LRAWWNNRQVRELPPYLRTTVAVDKLNWSGDTPQKVTPSPGMSF